MTRISSRAYLDGARGETCKLQIDGVCQGGTETTVACHVRDRHAGASIKASDISVVDGCFACHAVFDRRAKMPDGFLITGPDWLNYALHGLQLTLENRIERGIVTLKIDAEPERKVKPHKPKSQRKPIRSNPKIPSRPMREK